MKDLAEVRSILASYTVSDLQKFSQLLQRFKAINTPPHIVRQVIADAVREAVAMRRVNPEKTVTPAKDTSKCPECGKPLSTLLADDTDGDGNVVAVVRISQCKSCRWSAIVE